MTAATIPEVGRLIVEAVARHSPQGICSERLVHALTVLGFAHEDIRSVLDKLCAEGKISFGFDTKLYLCGR